MLQLNRPADVRFPALRMNVENVEPESIFLDDPVDFSVVRLADRLSCVLHGTALSHPDEKFDLESLEERGGTSLEFVE